jgi:hypothetical protein
MAFVPTDHRQGFCCIRCQRKRAGWKSYRGAPLVDLLLTGDAEGLAKACTKMKLEIQENTP